MPYAEKYEWSCEEMVNDPLYKKGYIQGYWDGIKDATSGKTTDWQRLDIVELTIQAMGISTRACNCLKNTGYTHVKDLLTLNSYDIGRMRNIGRVTASEIARWLTEQGILCTAWSEYV